MAFKFVDTKEFGALDIELFKRIANKAKLPEKLMIDTVTNTVDAFIEVWPTAEELPLDPAYRILINEHLRSIPLWNK